MIKKIIFIFAAVILFVPQSGLRAQSDNAVALTITPPFFEINVSPGDSWVSSIRVVNTNASDLTVHASVMGFAPADDQGHGMFVDPSKITNDADALANWIIVSSPSVTVPRGGAADVPFSIIVPRGASPGGHYAAIMIGTAPGGVGAGGSHVGVSSFISALIFVRVSGDVIEQGNIQEFSTDHAYYQNSSVNFFLRFANTGNVHVRPQGEIDIYNAFGKQQAKIPVNEDGNLGYVLPSSTRAFHFSWQGGSSLLDIGPYTAVATLSYGQDGKKSATQTVTFWIVPLAALAEDILGGLLVGGAIIFILRRLVKKMLAREMTRYGVSNPPKPPRSPTHHPEKPGVIDLRDRRKDN